MLATKLIKKYLILIMLINTINYFWKTKTILAKRLKMSTQLPEYLENPNTKVKSVTREHSKTSYKLSKTRGHAKKV